MIGYKLVSTLLYAFLATIAYLFPLTVWSQFALGTLFALFALHALECILFREVIADAPGRSWQHVLLMLVYGLFHYIDMKDAIRAMRQRSRHA